MPAARSLTAPRSSSASGRWLRLVGGVLALLAVADAQLVATALAPLGAAPAGAAASAAQNALAAFVLAELLFVPLERRLLGSASPQLLAGAGAALAVASWLLSLRAGAPRAFLLLGVLGGAGAGLLYAGTVARSLDRFAGQRVQCLLAVAATCAAAAAAALGARLRATPDLLLWTIAQAAVILLATLYVVKPLPPDWEPPG